MHEVVTETGLAASAKSAIEASAMAIELLAVAIILIAIAVGTGRFLIGMQQRTTGAYQHYKVGLGKALLLGLEMLVAADVVRTVALEPTLERVTVLAVLVAVRTALSWSLVVEIEGHWPWRTAELEGASARPRGEE